MILLDTNIVVAYLNGHSGIAQRIADRLSEIAIPSLVAKELYYGACASARAKENLAKPDLFCQAVSITNFDLSAEQAGLMAARRFGVLKADLRKRGRLTGETDQV